MHKKPPYPLNSVDRALQLVQILRDTGSIRLVDAASELKVSPSTAHRLLSMLVYRGFAIQDDSRTYLPGPAMGEQPVVAAGTLKLKSLVQPHLERLSEATGETANLMIRVGTNIRFLSSVESRNILRVGDRQGAVMPARRASGGKALLAELNEPALRRIFGISGVHHDEEFEALLTELQSIRRLGFAANVEATEDGVCAFGTVVRDRNKAVAAISVSLPATRLSPPHRNVDATVRTKLLDGLHQARRGIETDLLEHPLPE